MNKLEKKYYPGWMATPGVTIYIVIFVIPTFFSFYFSMTTWNLRTSTFTGLKNFTTFFSMTNTRSALINTAIYAFSTSSLKIVIALLLASYICTGRKSSSYLKSMIYFPTLLGSVAVAIAWQTILDPTGVVNRLANLMNLPTIRYFTDPRYAMISCILVDVWKGLGTAMMIYIAGLSAIPRTYYEAAAIDGASSTQSFFRITLPLMVPSINTVLTLSLIGGLRTYELVYSLTGGGPGYSTEVLGSVIYKLFSRGSYGLATTGYVIMFVVISLIIYPINTYVSRKGEEING